MAVSVLGVCVSYTLVSIFNLGGVTHPMFKKNKDTVLDRS